MYLSNSTSCIYVGSTKYVRYPISPGQARTLQGTWAQGYI